jgi:hypothetical protein
MRIESERRERLTGERERRKEEEEICITRTELRPDDTLTGFKVVSLRQTGAATLISSRGGPVTCWKGGRGREGIGHSVGCDGQRRGRKVSRGGRERRLDRERREEREASLPLVLCLDI